MKSHIVRFVRVKMLNSNLLLVGIRSKVTIALVRSLVASLLLLGGSHNAKADEKTAIKNAAKAEDISESLLSAVCFVESGHRPLAHTKRDGKGRRDSFGLCQLQLRTAKSVGFLGEAQDLFDPYINALYAAKYLSGQLGRYGGNWEFAVAAYNLGSLRLDASGKPINKGYVKSVFQAIVDEK